MAAPDFIERAWRALSRWAVPVMMTLAYVLLAETSDTDLVGKAWMGVGLGLVMVAWFVFRALTETAALARALAVGDTVRLFALADRHLPRTHKPADRARFLVGRALGHQLRGQPAEALAVLAEARPGPDLAPLARAVRIGSLIELGRPVDDVRLDVSAASGNPAIGWLGDAELAWSAGALDAAAAQFARVIDDVRAGSATRAIAHVYAARIAEAKGDAAVAARHRAAATAAATPDATWLRAAR